MKHIFISTGLCLALWGGSSLAVRAQPGSGGPAPGAATVVPLDGGASLLLAGGVTYALRQLRARRRARQHGSAVK